KVGYTELIQTIENANTYEYRLVYSISDVYFNRIVLHDHEYFLITSHNIVLRKGINRSTNSYDIDTINRGDGVTRINLRVTLLKSFVNDNYPDDISTFFINNSALYVIYTPIDYDEG